jgi:crotonobetaine/carnitine-CoA ligase
VSGTPVTFAQRWDAAVSTSGDRPFLVFEGPDRSVSQWTYREFDGVVTRVGATLAAGVTPGSSVHGVKESAAGHLATIELAETAHDVSPAAGAGGRSAAAPARAAVAPADRLAVMFTSGTTSEPKGVVLTQHNYAHVADTMSAIVGLRPEHRWLVTLPLFHANAPYYCIAPAIAVGASVALTSAFSASQWLRQARDLSATHASLFAAPIRMILARRPADAPARAAGARLVRAEPRRAALRRVRGAGRLPPAPALRDDRDGRDRLRYRRSAAGRPP